MPVNYDRAMEIVGGDRALMAEISSLLLKQIDADLPAMHDCIKEHDTEALRKLAHSLKGSLSSLAATPAYEVCARLENLAQLAIPDPLVTTLAALEREIERLRPVLREMMGEKTLNH